MTLILPLSLCRGIARFAASAQPIAAAARLSFARKPLTSLVAVRDVGAVRAFSTSSVARRQELVQSLVKEIEYEKEDPERNTVPEFLKTFNAKNLFQIHDVAGENEVTLTRDFGDEKIKIYFSIDDISSPIEEDEAESAQSPVSFPISVVVNISKAAKPNVGVLTFHTVADGGMFHVENITHTTDVHLAAEESAEADYKRRGFYVGPVFNDLDETVQTQFYNFLEEHGIDSSLAQFIPSYVEWKEQNEYIRWLEKVKTFVQ